ncbi:MAG: ribosomal-processing cysteine protease Prp [Oscillospiraceae bacterium]|nr:ribosomal-processing cysteine protease Prp [Oscillospiraceae bacterium]
MTTLTFSLRGDDIIAVSVEGHAGYAESGEDIVCAGISALVQMVDCQLYMLETDADMSVDEETARIMIKVGNKEAITKAQLPLHALMVVAKSWQEEYTDFISVQEVKLL